MGKGRLRWLINELYAYLNLCGTCPEEIAVSESPILNDLSTTEDFRNLKVVTFTMLLTTHCTWRKFLALNFHNMLSSHEMYLRYVTVACHYVTHFTSNVFDKFLSLLVLVIVLNAETFGNAGVNFTKDLFMIIYDSDLKKLFTRKGGIKRLVEFANRHECLAWKWQWKDIILPSDPDIFVTSIRNDLTMKIGKEVGKNLLKPERIKHAQILSHRPSLIFARKVLSSIRDLPSMPSLDEVNDKQKAIKLEINSRVAVLHQSSRSNLDSGPTKNVEHKENDAWCENIVQAVVRYNNSKSSSPAASSNRILKEASGILQSLEINIASLIKVLEECAKD